MVPVLEAGFHVMPGDSATHIPSLDFESHSFTVCKMLLHDGMSRFETGSDKSQPKVPERRFIPFQWASSERDSWVFSLISSHQLVVS